jgi:NAD(P)-dependent dehydrogenase (short-subunit alcohol dehydrogenase family)
MTAESRTRTALVTGGTGGMGRIIAAKLAADGFDVAVASAGNVELADATVKEIAGHGRRGAAFAADIADEQAVSAVFDAVDDRFGHRCALRSRYASTAASSSSTAWRPAIQGISRRCRASGAGARTWRRWRPTRQASPRSLVEQVQERCEAFGARCDAGATLIDGVIFVRALTGQVWQAHEAVYRIWETLRPAIAGKPARPIQKP